MTEINTGLQSWRWKTNHNSMIKAQQGKTGHSGETVKVEYYGSSAFKITSPCGLTIMIDPWRNIPTRRWDWYFYDFPLTQVDIGVSTHAHFDHDALTRLDAHVLLDRLIGEYQFGDVRITGIADKHATDFSASNYDAGKILTAFSVDKITPPDNSRSWDNCLVVIETAGLRILHWGDNRHNPPEEIWQRIGKIDILLMPVDESQHVLSFENVEKIIARLQPSIVIPHHYYIWNVVQRASTLMSAEPWVKRQPHARFAKEPAFTYSRASLPAQTPTIDFFGDHVAFDTDKWHQSEGKAG